MNTKVFVNNLISVDLPHIFNPYSDHCRISDLTGAVELRCQNLEKYLNQLQELSVSTVWVGEALGYRGGRRTGLPFSDDTLLDTYSGYFGIELEDPTKNVLSEISASIIWEKLGEVDEVICLWNSFPFHPHEEDKPLSNRKPLRGDYKATEGLFNMFFDEMDFERIFAVGRAPETELERQGFDCTYLRHPSYGGANIFREQVDQLYAV